MKWLFIGGSLMAALAVDVGLVVRSCYDDRSDAEQTVAAFYEAMSEEDYEAALLLHHPDSWTRLSKEEMLNQLRQIRGRPGTRIGGRQVGWFVRKGSEAGVELTYESEYERTWAVEEFFLIRMDGEFRILVHNYQAQAK